jgi:deazaflavin-dependent oxidoreductase (nitroreductase family)
VATGGRILSALALPAFSLRPPSGYGVLTTTGRRTGKTRRKCIRAIRTGNRAYIVSILGAHGAWLKNIQADPNVRLRIRGGTFAGVARELREPADTEPARAAYCGTVTPGDYLACTVHLRGRPTRTKIKELTRTWFDQGTPLVIDLEE